MSFEYDPFDISAPTKFLTDYWWEEEDVGEGDWASVKKSHKYINPAWVSYSSDRQKYDDAVGLLGTDDASRGEDILMMMGYGRRPPVVAPELPPAAMPETPAAPPPLLPEPPAERPVIPWIFPETGPTARGLKSRQPPLRLALRLIQSWRAAPLPQPRHRAQRRRLLGYRLVRSIFITTILAYRFPHQHQLLPRPAS